MNKGKKQKTHENTLLMRKCGVQSPFAGQNIKQVATANTYSFVQKIYNFRVKYDEMIF